MPSYYPKNRIKENQYTSGGEYAYSSGIEYIGYYYVLSNGNVFSGKNPQDINSVKLISYIEGAQKLLFPTSSVYDRLMLNENIVKIKQYKPIPFYYPVLTQENYNFGSIIRYFCNRVDSNSTTIKEISGEVFNSLNNQDGTYDSVMHTFVSLPWLISGPLEDVYRNGILIRPGVKDTNLRQTQIADKKLPGLLGYLSNMVEFANIII